MGVDSTNVRIFWIGTSATIPAGWSRDTDFDTVFLQSDDETFTISGTAGGNHSHTYNVHGHTGDSHQHIFSGAVGTGTSFSYNQPFFGGFDFPKNLHVHLATSGANTTITYQNTTSIILSTDMTPPYVKVIVIKPDDTGQDIPDDGICITNETSIPDGYNITDGTNGTTDLDEKFLVGASPAGDGGDTGGSSTHIHTSSSHTHTIDDHEHTAVNAGTTQQLGKGQAGSPSTTTHMAVHQTIAMNSASLSDLSNDAITIDTQSNEPAFIELYGIQNISGAASTPTGVIVGFLGTPGSIHGNWSLCDGTKGTPNIRDKQLKLTKTAGDLENTGGSDTHTHTSQAHGHTHGAHNHTEFKTALVGSLTVKNGSRSGGLQKLPKHTHVWTINNATPTLQNAADPSMSTDDGRALYRTLIFIKKTRNVTVKLLGVKILGAKIK